MRLGAAILAALSLVLAMPATAAPPAPATADLAPTQLWSIKSATPTTAKVVIGRIEPFGDKTVVHVSIVDIPIPPGSPGAGRFTSIAHAPFDRAALAASVDRLLGTATLAPDFQRGYDQWRAARGGIYTVGVEAAVRLMFQTIGRGTPR